MELGPALCSYPQGHKAKRADSETTVRAMLTAWTKVEGGHMSPALPATPQDGSQLLFPEIICTELGQGVRCQSLYSLLTNEMLVWMLTAYKASFLVPVQTFL